MTNQILWIALALFAGIAAVGVYIVAVILSFFNSNAAIVTAGEAIEHADSRPKIRV